MRFASTLPDLIPSRLREKGPDDKSRSANNIPKTNDKSVFCSSMCAGCGEEAPGLGARDGKGQSRGAQASPARGHCLAASLALPPPRRPYPRSEASATFAQAKRQSARLALAGPTPQHHTAHASRLLSRARLAFAAHDATLHAASAAVGTLHVNRQSSQSPCLPPRTSDSSRAASLRGYIL